MSSVLTLGWSYCLSRLLLLGLGFLIFRGIVVAQTAVSVGDASGWNGWITGAGSIMADTKGDQQTGQSTDDFVGDATYYAFQQKSGTISGVDSILFRARFDTFAGTDKWGNGGNFGVGMDLDGSGSIDVIVMYTEGAGNVNNRSRTLNFGLPGTGANNSPSTTTWTFPTQTAINLTVNSTYSLVAATDFAGFNGTQDAWLTFGVSFQNLSNGIHLLYPTGPFSGDYATQTGYNIGYDTKVSFIAFTSQSANSLNQDLLGAGVGGTTSATSFADLGALTPPLETSGRIPEPATYLQVGMFGLLAAMMARRRWKKGVRFSPAATPHDV